jgi:hypothetical protein
MSMRAWPLVVLMLCALACGKPLVRASTYRMTPVVAQVSGGTNATYYGVRWALAERGYPVAFEDLNSGLVTSAWVPVSVDSHYIQPFTTRDYGTVGAYHQIEVRVMPGGGQTRVAVQSRVKSLANGIRSSQREERAIIAEIQKYLHGTQIDVTNVGVNP